MARRFSQRLAFRFGLSVVLIESIFIIGVGMIYYNLFAAQIDQRQVERLQIAAEILIQNQLNLTSLTDREMMSLLVGEEIKNAMLITDQGSIAFSLNPEYRRMAVEDIPFLPRHDLNFDHPTRIVKRVEVEGQPYLVNITSFYGGDRRKLILYFRTSVAGAEREKANVIILLLIGFATTVAATSTVLMFALNRMVLGRVGKLALAARKVEAGDLTVRADLDGTHGRGEDEIAVLQRGFNAMVERLQGFIETLEHRVAERTHELNESNQQLQIAKEKAETSDRAKSVFLANMSHELRTPLNAVLGFSQLIQADPAITQSQAKDLAIINRSGHHLLTLINDVLDMAKIESGQIKLAVESIDLGDLVRGVMDMVHQQIKEKGLQLIFDQSSDFPRYVQTDPTKLRQILLNLLGNAVKHTEQGGVTLRLGSVPDDDPAHIVLRIEVEDTGIGIAEKDLDRIFKPFEQVGQAAEQNGTGLGLALTRQYVELMGGKISVQSAMGKGSLFHAEILVTGVDEMTLIHAEPSRARVTALESGQPEYRILIVEDNLENRLLLKKLLQGVGFTVREAMDGRQAIEVFKQWRPHLIWMDRRMPVMDGITATQRIRQLPGGDKVKIIALTASVFKDQKNKVLEAGCDDFLPKPYKPDEIFKTMKKQLGVCYVYEGGPEKETAPISVDKLLTARALASVPAHLRDELMSAVLSLNMIKTNKLIEKIRSANSEVADALAQLAEAFGFEEIVEIMNNTEPDNQVKNYGK